MLPSFDFAAIPAPPLVNLAQAIDSLYDLYGELDAHMATIKAKYPQIPCAAGCSSCCHEAVFVTPLEFWAIIFYLQEHNLIDLLEKALKISSEIYKEHREVIEAFNAPPPPGEKDHFTLAKDLHYVCPFLQAGQCAIYPARSLIARLFGLSFERPGVVYGCRQIEKALAASQQEVSLPSCHFWLKRLKTLPYTSGRQVIPYYMVRLYGLES